MYKYLSAILGVALAVLAGVFLYQRHSHAAEVNALANKLAALQGTIKEKENLYSQQALVLKDAQDQLLSSLENKKEVEALLKQRDEQVYSLNQLVLHWKDKYFEIKDATGTVVGSDGTTVVAVPAECETCLVGRRFRVDFDKTEDYLRVEGHTLTNPPYAELKLEWVRDLRLNIIIAKDKGGRFRAYLDTNNSDLVPSKVGFVINEDAMKRKWYENLAIGGSINVGEGLATSINLGYEFGEDLLVGPNVVLMYDGKEVRTMYGGNVLYFPFR